MRPHAVSSITLTAGGHRDYQYDTNGNLTIETQYDAANAVIAAKGRTTAYTSFNLPKSITTPAATLSFQYGPEHQRTRQIAPGGTVIYVHPDDAGGLAYEKETKSDGSIENRYYISAGGQPVALIKKNGFPVTTTTAIASIVYLHRDALGSTTAITSSAGTVIERMAYEPFGKRRKPNGQTDPANTLKGVNTDRGYTNHEHLDEVGLIHMNGRVYDPMIGRFMSADSVIPDAQDLQSYNRYSYVNNNPLAYTDPTGHFLSGLGHFASQLGREQHRWEQDFRWEIRRPNSQLGTAIRIAGAAASVAICNGGTAACFALVNGLTEAGTSAAQGATGAQLLRNTAIAAASAYGFRYVGANYAAGSVGNYVGGALVGCAQAAAGGGECGQGAAAAFVGAWASSVSSEWGRVGQFVSATAAGGTASVITGGKFANGAVTGAFSYALGRAAQAIKDARQKGTLYVTGHRVGKVGPYHLAIEYDGQVISAGPVDGLLVSDINRPTDSPGLNVTIGEITPPEGTSAEAYFSSVQSADLRYCDCVEYDLFPGVMDSYNSNSYVHGLINATGGSSSVEFSRYFGGPKPLPSQYFGEP